MRTGSNAARMLRALAIAFILTSCASQRSVSEIVIHPSLFDEKHVVVRGFVCGKKEDFSKKTGSEFATYRLCDKRHSCIRVFGFDYRPDVKAGDFVSVAGIFEMITIEDPDIYLNELHPDSDDTHTVDITPHGNDSVNDACTE